jgi:hypothetical protein
MSKKFTITPTEKYSENFFNIFPASEFVPDWYRKSSSYIPNTNTELSLDQHSTTNSTYKRCTPFFDALTYGYMVVLTADVEVTRKPDGMPYLMWRTDRSIITEHTMDQWNGFPCPDGYSPYVYKWHNQFKITVPNDYSLLFLNPINRTDLPFFVINGIVDSDSYPGRVHFPFFIKNDFTGIIKKGTPITQIVPIKRDNWKRENKKYQEGLLEIHFEKFFSTIKRSYKNNYWKKKEFK